MKKKKGGKEAPFDPAPESSEEEGRGTTFPANASSLSLCGDRQRGGRREGERGEEKIERRPVACDALRGGRRFRRRFLHAFGQQKKGGRVAPASFIRDTPGGGGPEKKNTAPRVSSISSSLQGKGETSYCVLHFWKFYSFYYLFPIDKEAQGEEKKEKKDGKVGVFVTLLLYF